MRLSSWPAKASTDNLMKLWLTKGYPKIGKKETENVLIIKVSVKARCSHGQN